MSLTVAPEPLRTAPPKPLFRGVSYVVLALFLTVALMVFAFGLRRGQTETPLQQLGSVPTFSFTAQDGQVFSSQQLKGKVWVGNFIFSRCPTICPTFSRHMATIQKSTPPEVNLLSFSVDPLYDTPERLKVYGDRFSADFSRWRFLTADSETPVTELSKALFQPLERPKDEDLASLVHGSYFILVDRHQQVRGFYKFNDPESLKAIVVDAKRLLEEV